MFDFFYKRAYFLFAIIGFMFIFGIIGLIKMPKNLFPDANRPEVVVFTSSPGASARVVASSISKPIEEEMATLSDVYEITSTNVPNFSIVHIVFDYTKSLQDGAVDVSNALKRVILPKNSVSAIYLVGDFTTPVDVFALSPKNNSTTLNEIRKVAKAFIKPKLLANKEIGNVDIFGGYESAIMIKVDSFLLKKYNISLKELLDALKSNQDMPVGFLKSEKNFFTLSFYGEKKEIEKLKNTLIAKNVRLKDVADVKWSYQTNNSAYIGNNKDAIAIAIQRPINGSVLGASNAAREVMDEIKKEYPNIKISVSDTQRNLIETSNDNMLEALRDAIIYTLFVLLIFLANFRALIAAAISIPMVFFGTLAFLYLTGGELNIVIYTAIILALGMLTDDAVVVLENIERHLQEGDENAIYNGTKEVLKPIFAGTISTIAVIFPLMFVGGYPEKIFRPLIETLIVALLISWFLSVTFIPKLASYLYKKGTKKTKVERFFETLYQKTFAKLIPFYIGILEFSNKGVLRRVILMMGTFLFLVFSLKNIFPTIGRDVMPPMDTGIIKANIEFSSNLNADETKKRLKPFLEWLNSRPWLVKSSIAIGTERGVLSIGSGGGGNSVGMNIIAVDRFHRKKTIWEIEDEIRDKLATLKGIKKIAVFDFGATALSTIKAPLDVQFRSEVYDDLPKIAQKAKEALYNVRGLTSVIKSWDKDFEDVVIDIDSKKAMEFGISPIDILSQIAMKDSLVGIVSFASMNEPVRIRFKSSYEELKNLLIETKKGLVPLSYFGDIKKEFTYSRIDRYNLEYAIDVEGYRNKRPISKITDDANKILKEHKITNYHQIGDIKEMDDAFRRLIKAVLVGVVILILTLMVVYESIRYALIMIVVLPLSMIGAMWALLIANKPSCMPSMVGLLLLFGIIIKNAVLLIDFYKEFKTKSPFEAAKESVRLRFRPVLMTAFGTIAGMIPIALEKAVGLERLSPIADVAIGGLLVGTILTLVYIPMLAYSTDKLTNK